MSDSSTPPSGGPKKNGPPERSQPKVFIIWMVIGLAIVSLLLFNPPRDGNTRQLSAIEVVEAAEEGRIQEGVIENNPKGNDKFYEIRGIMSNPDYDGQSDVPQEIHFQAKGRLTDEEYTKLRPHLNEKAASTDLSDWLLFFLPILIFFALIYFFFVRQLRMAGKGAMSFGKSRAKMMVRDKDKVTFRDVAGCDEAKEEVQELVDFLKDPKKYQKMGARIPRGVLMVGAPGTGKTLLARAIAGEADVPFFSISGSDFVEMFVGVGAARVRDMFEQGRKNAPCLIFIDEIDAVGRQRGAGLGGGNDEREQTLNSLLVEMDGFEGHEGVIIIAATNRPDVLDNALLRPGRFDRQVTIDVPDMRGREEILKVHGKKVALGEDVDLSVTARNTPGFSGAELANLINEAALIAARYGKSHVDMASLDEARDKIAYGRERRRLMDDDDKKVTAYHEAGHAIVQATVDDGTMPVHKVTIIPRGQSLGSTMFMPKKDFLNYGKKKLLNQICTSMGGRIAEDIAIGDVTSGAQGDIKMATQMARRMVCDFGMSSLGPVAYGENQDHVFLGREITRQQNYSEETAREIDRAIRGIIDEQYSRAHSILEEKRQALDKLADALIEHETVEGIHVQEILEHGEIRSPIVLRPSSEIPPEENTADEKAQKEKERETGEELGPGEPAGAPA